MYQLLSFVATTALLCVVYWFGLAVYRLYYHPLAKFPGPKYAALSRWHECYYDVYRQGSFIFWIEEQHKRYGVCLLLSKLKGTYTAKTLITIRPHYPHQPGRTACIRRGLLGEPFHHQSGTSRQI